MSMKPGCVVYNPAENFWCVLVEHRRDDGEIRRFMSFHKNRLEAQMIKKAHEEANANEREVTVSMFEYDYIPNDKMLVARMMMDAFERMFVDADKERCNDCND